MLCLDANHAGERHDPEQSKGHDDQNEKEGVVAEPPKPQALDFENGNDNRILKLIKTFQPTAENS
jgi:hypothetical protein